MLNTMVLVENPGCADEVFLYYFQPFTADGCNNSEPIYLATFRNGMFHENFLVNLKHYHDFQNCRLRVGVRIQKPFINATVVDNKTIFTGFEGEILTALSNRIKFKVDLVPINGKNHNQMVTKDFLSL